MKTVHRLFAIACLSFACLASIAGCAADTETTDAPEASAADMTVDTGTGVLAGTLTMPAGGGPFSVVLIHAGSGPTDRDGNNRLIPGKNDSLRLLAAELAERGVASLRYDKRGIAASAPAAPMSDAELTFDMYVEDAVAWIDLLAADTRFDGVWFAGSRALYL
jgi:hypothetical protein